LSSEHSFEEEGSADAFSIVALRAAQDKSGYGIGMLDVLLWSALA
jgi:hypothetical protein